MLLHHLPLPPPIPSLHRSPFSGSPSSIPPSPPFRFLHSPPPPLLRVNAAVCYPASMAWWKKNNQPNMRDMNAPPEFFRALAEAQGKLVLVEFYAVGCRSCKAIHPKICQIAADNPDIDILKVDFYEHHAFSKSLNVNILPYFQFYRQERLLDAFSCSLTKIRKLREAVAKYKNADQQYILTSALGRPVKPLTNDLAGAMLASSRS